MKKKPRRKRYKVGLRKDYVPKELWPKPPNEFLAYVKMWSVLAHSRKEAAEAVWERYKDEILGMVNKPIPVGRQFSLEVDKPGVPHSIGHLSRIHVYTHEV